MAAALITTRSRFQLTHLIGPKIFQIWKKLIKRDIDFKSKTFGCVRVMDSLNELKDPQTIVVPLDAVNIEFDYPLHRSASFQHHTRGGFTRLGLFKRIRDDYRKIYKTPLEYGIWGHGIDDLFLEGATLDGNRLTLSMGS